MKRIMIRMSGATLGLALFVTSPAHALEDPQPSRFRQLLDEGEVEAAVTAALEDREPLGALDMDRILVFWESRALDVSVLQPLVIVSITEANFIASRGTPPFLRQWAELRLESGGVKAIESFLDSLATTLIGPRESRRRLIDEYDDPLRPTLGTPSARIRMLKDSLHELFELDPLIFPILDFSEHLGFFIGPDWSLRNRFATLIHGREGLDDFLDVLENSPFLGALAKFKTYPRNGVPGGSLLAMILLSLQGDRAALARAEFAAHLESLKPASFGSRLLLACVAESSAEAVCAHLATVREERDSLGRGRQQELAELAAAVLKARPTQAELSAAARETKAWIDRVLLSERDQKVARILAARNSDDLDLSDAKVLPEIVLEDRSEALAVFVKLVTLLEEEKDDIAPHATPGGRTVADDLLLDVCASLSNEKLHRSLFVQEVISSSKIGMELTASVLQTCHKGIFESFWPQTPGKTYPRALADFLLLLESLSIRIDGIPMISGGLVDILEYFNEGDLDASVAWLENELERRDSASSRLVHEFLAAARLCRYRKGGVNASDDRRFVKKYFEPIIDDVNTPLILRLDLASNLLVLRDLDERSTLRAVESLRQLWDEQRHVDSGTTLLVLNAFLLQSRTNGWAAQANALLSAWSADLRKKKAELSYTGSSTMESTALLEIALLSKNQILARTIVAEFTPRNTEAIAPLTVLVRHADSDNARHLLRQNWPVMRSMVYRYATWVPWYVWIDDDHGRSFYFDRELEERLAEWIHTLTDPTEKLLGEILVASAPDRVDDEQPASTTRKQRLGALAERFMEADRLGDSERRTCMAFLATEASTLRFIEDPLARATSDLSIREVVQQTSTKLAARDVQLLFAHIYRSLEKGEHDVFMEAYDELQETGFNTQRTLTEVARLFLNFLALRSYDWSPEWCSSVLPLFEKILSAESLPSDQRVWHAVHGIIFYVLAGQETKMGKWHDEEFDAAATNVTFHTIARDMIVYKDERLSDSQRVELVTRLYSNPRVARHYATEKSLFGDLISLKLLSAAELREHGPQLAQKSARRGHAWSELSELEREAGSVDASLEHLDRALAAAPEESRGDRALWQLAKSRILVDAMRREEAARILKALETEGLSEKQLRERAEMLDRIGPVE